MVIVFDDVGWGDFGCYGGGVAAGAPTPNKLPYLEAFQAGIGQHLMTYATYPAKHTWLRAWWTGRGTRHEQVSCELGATRRSARYRRQNERRATFAASTPPAKAVAVWTRTRRTP